jgi:hypothetical protein
VDKGGWSLKKILRSTVYMCRLGPGKELEDQVWIRDGGSLERKWKIKCG